MTRLKKIYQRYLSTLILVFIGFVALVHLLGESEESRNNKLKRSIIEEAIQSDDNKGLCQIPNLPINNSEILKFYKKDPPIDCGTKNGDWVICEKSKCSIKQSIIDEKGPITCSFTDIRRKSDYKTKYGKTSKTDNNFYILNETDFAKANCKASNGERWFGIVIGIRSNLRRPVPLPLPKINSNEVSNSRPLNVLIFGFDSLSKNAFIRKLPKTYDYLVNSLKGNVLQGYNIVGDGTPQALIPILTGHTELELPETRKRMHDSTYVNVYPMIWKDYQNQGYITAFNEDAPKIGTFSYRLNGFDDQPTDHYIRTFYVEADYYSNNFKQYCVGHKPSHQIMLDYTKNFMLKYENIPRFVFSFHGELSHDSINLVGAADPDVKKWLIELHRAGILNDTVLIMMSDHGNRFAAVRNTLQGKQEERLPFFSFVFPQWFKTKFKKEYENFVENQYRLTTPFDVHETLLHILHLSSGSTEPFKSRQNIQPFRALSLLSPIPKSRSCQTAFIEPHWCACLKWKQLNDTTSPLVQSLVSSIVSTINDYTATFRHLCEQLEVHEIDWVMQLVPNDNLLRFKQNKDMDGYLADLSSKTKVDIVLFQVRFITIPGYSIFEASVKYYVQSDKFNVNMLDISRTNVYGNQANCIYDTNPELRKYCFCKTV